MRQPSTVLDHLFSRGVLGSILVGTACGKTVEYGILILTPTVQVARLAAWLTATFGFVILYVYWADFEQAASDAADSAADAVQGDTDD